MPKKIPAITENRLTRVPDKQKKSAKNGTFRPPVWKYFQFTAKMGH